MATEPSLNGTKNFKYLKMWPLSVPTYFKNIKIEISIN